MKKLLAFITMILISSLSNGYEFKGYEMGTPLSDFKSRGVHEDVFLLTKHDRYLSWESKLICSDENKNEHILLLARYPEDTVVICSIKEVASGSRFSHYKNGYMWLKLGSSTYPIQPIFTFVSLKNGEEPVLSMIDFEFFTTSYQSTLSALIEKYKKPFSSSSQNLQNRFGSNFKNVKTVWRDKTSVIELQKYSGGYTSEKSSLIFFFKSGESQLNKLANEKYKDKKNAI